MGTLLRNATVGGILLGGALSGLAATPPTGATVEAPQITIRVYNYAEVPTATLDRAKNQVNKIFRHVGVGIIWVDCYPRSVSQAVSCNQLLSPNEILLRILRRPKGEVEFEQNTGGAAFRVGRETGSGLISLYYDRVEQIASNLNLSRDVVLGHIAAHEFGHLLLPPGRHSQHGIMRAVLTARDWVSAEQDALLFTPEQSQSILAGVLARGGQQETYGQASKPASTK